MIKEGLRRCNFNKSKLAKELGVSRASLIMKVDKYGFDKREGCRRMTSFAMRKLVGPVEKPCDY